MYLSGTFQDFETRLHSLTQTSGDLNNFIFEGSGYLNTVDFGLVQKWNNEFAKRLFSLYGDSSYYINPVFFSNINGNLLLDVNGNAILDINGQLIYGI